MQVIKQDQIQEKIITLRNQKVLIDADVAKLYGVETKRVNEAVKIIQRNFRMAIYSKSTVKREMN